LWSAVEVDSDGHLYFTTANAVVSLHADGADRWSTQPLAGLDPSRGNGAVGLHSHHLGQIATVTEQGDALLLSRSTGELLTRFSIPSEFDVGLPPKVPPGVLASLLPASVIGDFNSLQMGGPTEFLSICSDEANYSDNTIAIGDTGHLYVIG